MAEKQNFTEIEKIKKLIYELNQASHVYYNGLNTLMNDHEWDKKYDELKMLENKTGILFPNSPTQNVGYEVKTELMKVKHNHSMLSLDKVHTIDGIKDFVSDHPSYISVKLDGLTTSIRYVNGKLISAETRGDGEIGVDVLHNVKTVSNVPQEIPYQDELIVDGEMIIDYQTFDQINDKLPEDKKYKNPRNLVSGTLQLLDSNIAKERNMKFIAWRVIKGFEDIDNNTGRFAKLKELGFTIVPYYLYDAKYANNTDLESMINYIRDVADESAYPCDGAVIGYDSISYGMSLGRTEKFFRHSIAYKYEDKLYETTLRDIKWNTSKTGMINPVAIFDTVEIDGTEVSKATLHNISYMKQLKLGIGDRIRVFKANQIIPKVFDNITMSSIYKIPETCPVCGYPATVVSGKEGEFLYCSNGNCVGKLLGKLVSFVSRNKMNIDGLSEATIERFVKLHFLSDFCDIYTLKDHESAIKALSGFGERSCKKLLSSIEKSKNVTLNKFIAALAIPTIGDRTAKCIAEYFNYDFDAFYENLKNKFDWTKIESIGEITNVEINKWYGSNQNSLNKLLPHIHFIMPNTSNKEQKLTNQTIVITGSVYHYKNRKELQQVIESFGGKTTGSVTTKTSYLINNDKNSNSSKNKKAKELGIPIISEEEFLKMIKEK